VMKGGDKIGFTGHKKVKATESPPSAIGTAMSLRRLLQNLVIATSRRSYATLYQWQCTLPILLALSSRVIVSLHGVYDYQINRKAIFNRGMVPSINANPRCRKATKRDGKPLFDAAIVKERFRTVERVFGWENKFRHLLLRFERLGQLHHAFKTLAYTMINLWHFCRS
jgi:hypothetical protein